MGSIDLPPQEQVQHIPEIIPVVEPWYYSLSWEWAGLIIPAVIIWYFKERITLSMKKRYDRWKKQHDAGEDV